MAVPKRISKCRDDKPRFRIFDRLREQETEDRPFTEIVPEWLRSLSDCKHTSTNEQHTLQDKVNPSARAFHHPPPATLNELPFKRKAEPQELEEPNIERNARVRRTRRPLCPIHFSPRQPPTPRENRPSQSPFPKQSARHRGRQDTNTPKMSIPIRQRKGEKITQSTSRNVDQADEAPIEGAMTRARARNNTKPSNSDKESKRTVMFTESTSLSLEDSCDAISDAGDEAIFTKPPTTLSNPFSTQKSSRVRQPSPIKSTSTSSKASVSMTKRDRMAFLSPAIEFSSISSIKEKLTLPKTVLTLWTEYLRPHDGPYIPAKLKDRIRAVLDTPIKSRPQINDAAFGPSLLNYRGTDPKLIWSTIDDVVKQADRFRDRICTEAHWISVVISPLLNLVRRLQRFDREKMELEVLDISYVNVSPSNLCTYDEDNYFSDLAKKIDMAMGLHPSSAECRQLRRAKFNYKNSVPSINQTSSFVNMTPMFLNIEVKMPNTDKDPLIQLASWIVAEFEKR
ncbi:MAG: hypothetical protein Q9164_005303 [Protoblastenia rupestris]